MTATIKPRPYLPFRVDWEDYHGKWRCAARFALEGDARLYAGCCLGKGPDVKTVRLTRGRWHVDIVTKANKLDKRPLGTWCHEWGIDTKGA